MADVLKGNQAKNLEKFWLDCGGLERLAKGFVSELSFFMEHVPELITGGNKRIETTESRDYADIAKQCDKLLKALEAIPELDRLNLLSPREERPEYNGRALPVYDPLQYVQTLQENAKLHSRRIESCTKYKRQLGDLRDFLDRFPPLRNISRSKFIELAGELWPDVNLDNFRKAYRPGKK